MEHSNLTIVAVYGHTDGSSAIPALMKSLHELPGSRALLISNNRPADLPVQIQWAFTKPMTYYQYTFFMMYCLHMYIETDFCLTVQDDGWVLNGQNFRQEFYDYDYIGSPTHAGLHGDNLYLQFSWQQFENPTVVQNGGFSLRSKKFLEAPAKHGIMHTLHKVEPFINEDVQLTCLLKEQMESVGIKYAPLWVAKNFGMEYKGPKFHDGFNYGYLLGHHAPNRKLVSDTHIKCAHPLSKVIAYYGELDFLQYLQHNGYTVEYFDESPAKQERANAPDQGVTV